MNSPSASGQTAIRVLGEDVVGSLQYTPSMDSERAPALTSLLNFSTKRSASRLVPGRMPKERRRLDQKDGHASEERPDPAFERPFPPHSPPSLT